MANTPPPFARIPSFGWNQGSQISVDHRKDHVRYALAQMPHREFMDAKVPPFGYANRNYLLHEEWCEVWQAEYDFRFLLRPAMPGPQSQDTSRLVRPMEET